MASKSFLILIALLGSSITSAAQVFTTRGSITTGFRFTDVSGRQQKFDELFSLRSGFRVHDFSVFTRTEDSESFADSISVSGYGLGGDPFSGVGIKMRRNGVYDLRVDYRQTYYYWDRNDDATHPTGGHGLTTNHDFATVRRFGSADFTYYATPNLQVGAEYHRAQRLGNRLSTRVLEYFDPPSSWGSFLRANPYLVNGPADEVSNRLAGTLTYTRGGWSAFFRGGYQQYEEDLEIRNLSAVQPSINVDDPATAGEPVNVAEWSEFRERGAPFSEISYNGRVSSRWTLRGGYLYYRYSGPYSTTAFFDGLARTDRGGAVIEPFTASMTIDGRSAEPNHVIDQGFTLELLEILALHTDYRYSRFTMENRAAFTSVDGDGPHNGLEESRWRQGLHTLDVALEISPAPNLLLRPGVRLLKRDVAYERNGVGIENASRPSKIASPILSVYYAPSATLTLRGDVRNTTNGGPYTRITPRTNFGSRWVIRYAPTERFSIENTFRFTNAAYTTTEFENKIRSNSTILTYVVAEDLSLTGGFTYDSFLATADIEFIRGTPPREATWRDQTINRVWQGGVHVQPHARVVVRLSGNYVRTTGAGEISGEPPTFGPLTWPMITGTVEMDTGQVGIFALDLQRTYYIEEIMTDDNFSANILGIRWRKDF